MNRFTNGSHKIDYFAHSGIKKTLICCEVKSKRRMAYYPETGFNVSNYKHYIEIMDNYNIDTFVFFVDDFEECIYGQWLSKLGEGTIRRNVITWGLSLMKKISNLNEAEIYELRKFTSENYDYSSVKRYFNLDIQ